MIGGGMLGLALGNALPTVERHLASNALEASTRRGLGLKGAPGWKIPFIAPKGTWNAVEKHLKYVDSLKPGPWKDLQRFFQKNTWTSVLYMPSQGGMQAGESIGRLAKHLPDSVKEDIAAFVSPNLEKQIAVAKKYDPLGKEMNRLIERLPSGSATDMNTLVGNIKKINDNIDKVKGYLDYVKENPATLAGLGVVGAAGGYALGSSSSDEPEYRPYPRQPEYASYPSYPAAQEYIPQYASSPYIKESAAKRTMVGEKKPALPIGLSSKYKSPHKRLINQAIKANTTQGKSSIDVMLTYTKKDGKKAMRMIRPVTTRGDLIIARDHMRDGGYRSYKLDRIHTMEKAAMHQSFRIGFEKLGFLLADPAEYKMSLKYISSKGPEAAKDLAHGKVYYGSQLKNKITDKYTVEAARKEHEAAKRLKAAYPKGTQYPGTPKMVADFREGSPMSTKMDLDSARRELQTQTNYRGYNRQNESDIAQALSKTTTPQKAGEIIRRGMIKDPTHKGWAGLDTKYMPHITGSNRRNN